MRLFYWIAVFMFGIGEFGPILNAQESGNATAFGKLADTVASEYSITAGGKSLQLRNESVLTWTNPLVGEIYGGVYVWTLDGRPAVIASIFKWYRPFTHSTHEFQSLSTKAIVATRESTNRWNTSKPGLKWSQLPDAPAVGKTLAQRLVQMRGLAKRFEFQMTEKDETTTRLRLLSQPLLRFQGEASGVIDGALFAYAKATDPESLLLVEARTDNGRSEWHYAIARSNFLPIQATYRGEQVWSVPRLENAEIYSANGPYAKFQID